MSEGGAEADDAPAGAGEQSVDEGSGEPGFGEQAVPGLERRGEQAAGGWPRCRRGRRRAASTMPSTTGAAMPTAGLRDQTESSDGQAGEPEHRGSAGRPARRRRARSAVRGTDGLAREPDQRLVADDEHARDDGGGGEQRRARRTAKPTRGDRLGPEELRPAGRPGQHGLPGAVLVLAGEDVTGDDGGQQRQHPLGGEPEDEQRQGEPVVGGEPAEQRVLGRAATGRG